MRVYSFSYLRCTPPEESEDVLVMDVRDIPEPKEDIFNDLSMRQQVMNHPKTNEYISAGVKFLQSNPNGTVAVGCKHGRQRSYTIAEMIARGLNIDAGHVFSD